MSEACSLNSNVEDENDVVVDMRLLDDVDYFVVMACCYIIYYLSYFCMLSIACQSDLANQLNLANNQFKSD
jgi:hypothetical protein